MKTKKIVRNKRVAQRRQTTLAVSSARRAQPFTSHLLELRRRVFICAASVAVGAGAAYFVQQQLVAVLLKPAGNQQFIYTSPGGGLNFLIQLCIFTGILLSTPVVMYNILKFIEPVMSEGSSRLILRGSAIAGLLAVGGVVFAYYFGLPSALKFLSQQFITDQVKALIAVQSYMSFIMKFLLGAALIFQAPLLMLLINRIKPLKPKKLLGAERWVILMSFILGAVISPTPDIRSMMLLSIPMIVTYHIGVLLVWQVNRRARKPASVLALLEQDALAQAERLDKAKNAFMMQFGQLARVPVMANDGSQENFVSAISPRTSMQPQAQALATTGGRTNYQYTIPSRRVRRRVML